MAQDNERGSWPAALLLLLTLVHSAVCEQHAENYPCHLSPQEVSKLVSNSTRTWTIGDDTLREHDIQAIVNCSRKGDIISLQTAKRIQPRGRIVVPWQLTIGRVSDGKGAGIIDDLKASLTCPSNDGLFLLKGVGVTFSNLIIRGCDLAAKDAVVAIVETDSCSHPSAERAVIQLHNVEFVKNRNQGGAVGLVVTEPSCYKVIMQHVQFRSNQYADSSAFSHKNVLEDVLLDGNKNLKRVTTTKPLFFFPRESDTTVHRLSAKYNKGTLLHADGGMIDMQGSDFSGNSARIRGAIVASASDVSISSSVFDSNSCKRKGAAVTLSDGSNGKFDSVQFTNNSALDGGALFLRNPQLLQFTL